MPQCLIDLGDLELCEMNNMKNQQSITRSEQKNGTNIYKIQNPSKEMDMGETRLNVYTYYAHDFQVNENIAKLSIR